jgi:hypothetical protein
MHMPLTICSDVHLCPESPERNELFFQWLSRLSNTHLVIAGDLFHYWWDYEEVPEKYATLLKPFHYLKNQNVTLSLLAGNHDFTLPGKLENIECSLPGGMVLEHGDAADKSKGYLFITKLLRGPVFEFFMNRLKPDWGFFVLRCLAGNSNRPFKPNRALIKAQRIHGLKMLESSLWVLQGHSHLLAHEKYSNGELVWLGDWITHQSYAHWENGTLKLCRWCPSGPQQEIVVAMEQLGPA